MEELLRQTLDEVGWLVGSPIGFFHFVEPDQETLSLQAWSTATRERFCQAQGQGLHYRIDQAGVWVDCVRQRGPVVHNDYRSLPHKKGMPEGHAPVIRELVVPIFRQDLIVAILGVGNKAGDYTAQDIEVVSYLADVAWEIVKAKRTEESLKESEEKYQTLVENMMDGVFLSSPDGRIFAANKAACEMVGMTESEIIEAGRNGVVDMDDPRLPAALEERAKTGKFRGELNFRKKDGAIFPVEVFSSVYTDKHGNQKTSMTVRDISERKMAEQRIKHLNSVLLAIREVNQLIVRGRDEGTLIREGCRVLVDNRGYASALIVLRADNEVPVQWADAGMGAASEPLGELLKSGAVPPCFDHVRGKKQVLLIEERKAICGDCPIVATCAESQSMCVELVHEAAHFGFLAVSMDAHLFVDDEERSLFSEMAGDFAYALFVLKMNKISQQVEKERKSLEGQLLQAQKMESVGRLAGGVAHDFNNMLTVIIGNAELAQSELDKDTPLYKTLDEILEAGRRSADLTRQLLAFARKQVIKPVVLDLNESVEGMLKMLRRLLGEDIDILWKPSANLWPVRMDPAQIDQIMANLCVNARDAILGQGKVTIETENITFDAEYCDEHKGFHPGEFVMLAVSDNGVGMDRETLDKAFEPFFTTKEEGQGTGLGLSMIYGIVKQNKSYVNVYSEPGHGTTFKIYFPRHEGGIPQTVVQTVPETMRGRGETVLLVEDESTIIKIGQRILEMLGYNVLTAKRPGEALRLAKEHLDEIDLLITDVIMPEMNGRELEKRYREIQPGIRCLFMSGYTANVIAHHGVIEEDIHFLQKPISLLSMAKKVREVLDSGNQRDT
ncbi:MAG: GAF domain-containing protein [Thermodesulfobacteriota bacterium]